MKVKGYSSEELKSFYCVLDRVVTEASERNLQLTIYEMIQRLFEAADNGERNPDKLRIAILLHEGEARDFRLSA